MEKFKIDHFTKGNDGISFPKFEPLSSKECEDIRCQICEHLDLPDGCIGPTLASTIAGLQVILRSADAKDDDFDLASVANSIGIKKPNEVFLNWHHFDRIDKLAFNDLSKFFHDIWYPGSDDIDIFDSSLSWIISVNHEGSVQFIAKQDQETGSA